MTVYADTYHNRENLKAFLDARSFDYDSTCLIKIFTSVLSREQSVAVAKELKELVPRAVIVGASSSIGVILGNSQYDNETIVVIEQYQSLQLKVEYFDWLDKSADTLAGEVHNAFCNESSISNALVHIIFSDRYPNVHFFVDEINKLSPMIKLVGGVAGDLLTDHDSKPGFVFDEVGVKEYGAIAFTAIGNTVSSFSDVSTSMEIVSPTYEITKVDGERLLEIENTPATQWLFNYLSLDDEQLISNVSYEDIANSDYLAHFPLLLEDHGHSGRFTRYDDKTDSLCLYHSTVPANTKFRLGYVSPGKTVRETHNVCEAVLDTPIECMTAYVCIMRKLYQSNCAKWELAPFKNANLSGAFMMGEIGFKDGANRFYNGASVFCGNAENNRHLVPDFMALEDTTEIERDDEFTSKARKKGRELLKKGASLYVKESDFSTVSTNSVSYFDNDLNAPNVFAFERDNADNRYNKICMVEALTADRTIATQGMEVYYRASREILKNVSKLLSTMLSEHLSLYTINYKTFMVVGSEDISNDYFTECMKKLHLAFEYVRAGDMMVSGVIRFLVALNQSRMLEVGLNLLLATSGTPSNFLVVEDDHSREGGGDDETDSLSLISFAISHDSVIPYYQGMYNNEGNTIDKYEALMRIKDANGKIYAPGAFMSTSKKYGFYNKLSQIMIDRVLCDFANRNESVSINISQYDIATEQFSTWLIDRLRAFPNPERIVLEFVETESYQDLDTLFSFIDQSRSLGIKVAIDDFGSGYSTFSTIISLSPDFIKIDGSIVSKISENKSNRIILDTICHLADQMGAEAVAEFVENAETQDIIREYKIAYSQGYHFSKPAPIEAIVD